MTRQILRDDRLQEEFLANGYVKVPLLSRDEVSDLQEQLAALEPDDRFTPSLITHHVSFLDTNLEYKRRAFELISSVFDTHVAQVLVDFELLIGNFHVKPPGTGALSVHQNWPFVTDISDTTVTIWCPLVDVTEDNGALQVVEGSHKIVTHIEGPHSPPFFAEFTDLIIREYSRAIPMAAGEALIFDDSLIHWSGRNTAEQPRVAIQAGCIPVDATAAFYCATDDGRFELIAVDRDFFQEHSLADMSSRKPEWRSLGFVDDPNQPISRDEFVRRLGSRDNARASKNVQSAAGDRTPIDRRQRRWLLRRS
jgi:hypothetical protein